MFFLSSMIKYNTSIIPNIKEIYLLLTNKHFTGPAFLSSFIFSFHPLIKILTSSESPNVSQDELKERQGKSLKNPWTQYLPLDN